MLPVSELGMPEWNKLCRISHIGSIPCLRFANRKAADEFASFLQKDLQAPIVCSWFGNCITLGDVTDDRVIRYAYHVWNVSEYMDESEMTYCREVFLNKIRTEKEGL